METHVERSWSELFFAHKVSEQHTETLAEVRNAFAKLADHMQELLPAGRYKAIVRTHLEEAAAMATKAFTHE